MAIVRRTSDWLPSIFNDFFGNEWLESRAASCAPAVNIQQHDNGFTVEVAAPGMTKDDCVVRIDEDNNLVVEFEKKVEDEEKDKKKGSYVRREFSYSKFQRRMILPENVDKDKISAKVENGILSVEIPTLKEDKVVKSKLIDIK